MVWVVRPNSFEQIYLVSSLVLGLTWPQLPHCHCEGAFQARGTRNACNYYITITYHMGLMPTVVEMPCLAACSDMYAKQRHVFQPGPFKIQSKFWLCHHQLVTISNL